MKKNVKLAAVVIASMLVLAACGKTEASVEASVETSTEASVEASVETSTEASVEELVEEVVEEEEKEVASVEEELNNAVATGTLEEYFAENEDEYQAMKAQEVEGLTIDVKGNVVVYNYSLPIEVDETTAPTYAAAFADQMTDDSASVKQLTDAIKMVEQGSGIEGIVFTLTYVDANGVEVYSCKLDANGVVEE